MGGSRCRGGEGGGGYAGTPRDVLLEPGGRVAKGQRAVLPLGPSLGLRDAAAEAGERCCGNQAAARRMRRSGPAPPWCPKSNKGRCPLPPSDSLPGSRTSMGSGMLPAGSTWAGVGSWLVLQGFPPGIFRSIRSDTLSSTGKHPPTPAAPAVPGLALVVPGRGLLSPPSACGHWTNMRMAGPVSPRPNVPVVGGWASWAFPPWTSGP